MILWLGVGNGPRENLVDIGGDRVAESMKFCSCQYWLYYIHPFVYSVILFEWKIFFCVCILEISQSYHIHPLL